MPEFGTRLHAGAVALGFDLPRLRFAFRTALAACIAFVVAWGLGLDHPQWAAMTVWAASQPTRGQLLEKGFFRAVGTLVGVGVGVLLVFLSQGVPLIMVAGLAIWIAACVAAGNLLRGLVAYGVMLAGYSAAMVGLLDFGNPAHVLVLGADRAATIFTGVAISVATGWLFIPTAAEEAMVGRMRRLTAGLLDALVQRIATGGEGILSNEEYRLLSEMAMLDEQLDPHGAGKRRGRQAVRSMRVILSAQISVLMLGRGIAVADHAAVSDALTQAARLIAAGEMTEEPLALIDGAAARLQRNPDLSAALLALAGGIRAHRAVRDDRDAEMPAIFPGVLHRDWVGARQAGTRAGLSVLAVGLFWVSTGWAGAPFLLLGLSIMTTVFSTFDSPAQMMRPVFIGQACGALGALVCQFAVWPLASSEFEVVLLTLPFILLSALFFSQRRMVASAFDYSMVSLLLLHPHFPLAGHFLPALSNVVAVVLAPLTAFVAYKAIYPHDAGNRLQTLTGMMVGELQSMARVADASEHRLVWRARFYHRMLRMIRFAERSGDRGHRVIDGGIAVLSVGQAVLALQGMIRENRLSPPDRRAALVALERLRQVRTAPDRAVAALIRIAARLKADQGRATMATAARHLEEQRDFFRRAG